MESQVKPIDVGQYIIDAFIKKGEGITTLKLQKLVFYSQAFSMVWNDKPLFDEDFQAWINGPVVYSLFEALRGYYFCPREIPNAEPGKLTADQKDIIDKVVEHYGGLTAYDLVVLTHSESPWKDARKGLSPSTPSNEIISKQSMAEFYMSQVTQ